MRPVALLSMLRVLLAACATTEPAIGAEGLEFFRAAHGDDTVGTVLLFRDDSATGMHMMGVLPEQRRRGHARAIMHLALERSSAAHAGDAVLQASTAGEPRCRSMGCESQRGIPHYVPAARA